MLATMLAELRELAAANANLHDDFDKFQAEYQGHPGALLDSLSKKFGADLWKSFNDTAHFIQNVETGTYSHVALSLALCKKMAELRHHVFLSFRRLTALNILKTKDKHSGYCPLCLNKCSKDNPRATSHVVADAAYREMILQFDSHMDGSIRMFDGKVVVKGKTGPTSIKWKMLCRECENFVSLSGEGQFTNMLKTHLPKINDAIVEENAQWRFTFAATLLWRAMHVTQPLISCADTSLLYQLYDELTTGIKEERNAKVVGGRAVAPFPSTTAAQQLMKTPGLFLMATIV